MSKVNRLSGRTRYSVWVVVRAKDTSGEVALRSNAFITVVKYPDLWSKQAVAGFQGWPQSLAFEHGYLLVERGFPGRIASCIEENTGAPNTPIRTGP